MTSFTTFRETVHRFLFLQGLLCILSGLAYLSAAHGQTVTLTKNIVGQGTVSPVASVYPLGVIVTLSATPAQGWRFQSWSGDLSGANPIGTLTLNANKSVTATFVRRPPFIQATLRDELIDQNANGAADPGEVVLYTVELTNLETEPIPYSVRIELEPNLILDRPSINAPGGTIVDGSGNDLIVDYKGHVTVLKLSFQGTVTSSNEIDDACLITTQGQLVDKDGVHIVLTDDPDTEAHNDPTRTPVACLIPVAKKIPLSGTKYHDLNRNGIKDAGEPGLPGWTMVLQNGTTLNTTTTNALGEYSFTVSGAGTYRIREVVQPGWVQISPGSVHHVVTVTTTTPSVTGLDFGNYAIACKQPETTQPFQGGVADGFNTSNAEPTNSFTLPFSSSPPTLTSFDTIPNDKYFVHRFSGIASPGTTIMGARMKIRMKAGTDDPLSDWIGFIDGSVVVWNARLRDLNGGSWSAHTDQTFTLDLADLKDINGNPLPNTLGTTNVLASLMDGNHDIYIQDDTGVDFITLEVDYCRMAGACGTKFNDLNGNGVRDTGEGPIAGVTIQLYNAAGTTLLGSAVTDAQGNYCIKTGASTYTLKEVVPSGYQQTAPAGGSYTVTLGPGGMQTGLNFGNRLKCVNMEVVKPFTYQGNFVFSGAIEVTNGSLTPAHHVMVTSATPGVGVVPGMFSLSSALSFGGSATISPITLTNVGTAPGPMPPITLVVSLKGELDPATGLYEWCCAPDTFRVELGQVPTGTEEEASLPATFVVEDNYPNPFNPSTQIRYAVPQAAHVRLKVYDLMGREVATLVDGTQQPGWHTATFRADQLASGIYLYRLTAGSFVETKRMMLVK